MMAPSLKEISPLIVDLVHILCTKNYVRLENDGRSGRLTAKEIELAINEYGQTLIELPEEALSNVDINTTNDPNYWWIDIDLWTKEEGQSDLTLSLSLHRNKDQNLILKMDDLHVL